MRLSFMKLPRKNLTDFMIDDLFIVKRPGINSTFQDLGRQNFYHIGLPFSGAMDIRNFLISNKLSGNKINDPALEFAYQGPLLEYKGKKKRNIIITGDVNFEIIRFNNFKFKGECYKTIEICNGDKVDIISTNQSVYGYFNVSGGFLLQKVWNSYSTTAKAKIGSNNGEKLKLNQNVRLKNPFDLKSREINFIKNKVEFIRVLKGTNFDYFSDKSKYDFFSKEFLVTKLTDRMGMRIKGPKIENIVSSNIKSEGLVKGTIQVPTDGDPIIMLSDHGTIGGYPKFGVIISADYDRIVQLSPGSKIKFKLINLNEAENIFRLYSMDTKNILNKIL